MQSCPRKSPVENFHTNKKSRKKFERRLFQITVKNMKRYLFTLLAVLLLSALLFTSCSNDKSTTDTPTTSESGIPKDSIVLTIGDFEVTKSLFRYYYDTILANYEYEDSDFLTKTENAVEKVIEEALYECKKDAAYKMLFNESGAELPEDWETKYEAYKEETGTYFLYYYGISLEQYMEEVGMTDDIFKMFYLEDSIYFDAIEEYAVKEDDPKADLSEEAFEDFAKDYVTVRHILVGYTDGLSDEKALERANEMITRYKDGENFEELQRQFSNDYQSTGSNVYTFTYGEMVTEFEDTSFKLKENEISEPVKTQFGYHVILRLPYPEDFNQTYFYPHATEKYIESVTAHLTESKTELYDVMIGEINQND